MPTPQEIRPYKGTINHWLGGVALGGGPLSSHEKTVDQNRSQKLGFSAIFVRVAIDSIETFTSSIGRTGIGVVTSAIDRMKCNDLWEVRSCDLEISRQDSANVSETNSG